MLQQDYLFLGGSSYDFVNKDNDRVAGVSVFLGVPDYQIGVRETLVGMKVLKFSMPYNQWGIVETFKTLTPVTGRLQINDKNVRLLSLKKNDDVKLEDMLAEVGADTGGVTIADFIS